jgi:4-hydroxy-tetrahydrodipicolinate reductase
MTAGDGLRVAVAGATGRTGSEVAAEARERGHAAVAVSREPTGDRRDEADLPAVLAEEGIDALVDFTVPEATVEHVRAAADAGVPAVVGTTGFGGEGSEALRAASERTPVLKAANFARGVTALRRAVREAVAALPGYDVELTETHHDGKRDAPSGTAKTLLDDVEGAREGPSERTYGREGHHPRDPAEVGVHVRRAGTVRGEHELLVADNDEVVTLTHRAESRRVFAAGALDATEWLVGRDPGFYDFEDVIDA